MHLQPWLQLRQTMCSICFHPTKRWWCSSTCNHTYHNHFLPFNNSSNNRFSSSKLLNSRKSLKISLVLSSSRLPSSSNKQLIQDWKNLRVSQLSSVSLLKLNREEKLRSRWRTIKLTLCFLNLINKTSRMTKPNVLRCANHLKDKFSYSLNNSNSNNRLKKQSMSPLFVCSAACRTCSVITLSTSFSNPLCKSQHDRVTLKTE